MLFLTKVAEVRTYRSGEVIFLEGDPARYIYYLEEGLALTCSDGPDGRERGVMTVWPGSSSARRPSSGETDTGPPPWP